MQIKNHGHSNLHAGKAIRVLLFHLIVTHGGLSMWPLCFLNLEKQQYLFGQLHDFLPGARFSPPFGHRGGPSASSQ